ELQLAVFLHRIGGKSNIFEICSRFGIVEGTVILYIKKVIKVIISKKSLFVQWPKGEQQKLVHKGFQLIGGFTNVIGAIDETYFILNDKPSNSPELYFNRKKFYSIQCQGIVDFHGIFISYDIGWPGSIHDAKVYKNSSFYKKKNELIINNDYLLGDSAYPILPFLITPF
ncbi:13987_t:CDS:1, partial [Funneliformis geosporum]